MKEPVFKRSLTTAACLLVCAGLVFTVQKMGVGNDSAKESAVEIEYQKASSAVEVREEETRPETEASIAPESAKEEKAAEEAKMEASINKATEKVENESAKEGNVKNEDGLSGTMAWDLSGVKKRMASYPDAYEDILKLEGVYVLVHGTAEKGQELWDAFLKHVDAGEAAEAEIIRFTVEGDPIIETVYFDGKVFYLCVDNSRDAYRGSGDSYYEAQYSSLVKEEKVLEGGGKTIEYSLTDGQKEYSIVYISE